MNESIRVHIVNKKRGALYMRYVDPDTGKQIHRSTGTSKMGDAVKAAGAWEKELREGKYKPKSRVTWAEFREAFQESAVFGEFAETSQRKFFTTFKAVEEILSPLKLSSLTTARINTLSAELQRRGQSDFTIKCHLALIRRALNWAHENGMLIEVPKFTMPKRTKGSKMMKGRPITGEEFDRMIAAIPDVVYRRNAAKWERLLRGLYLSGLRLGEAIDLWWDRPDRMHVDLSEKRPMLRIFADQEKGGQDRLLPITPDFAEFLLKTPEAEREGLVFKLGQRTLTTISNVISKIGEKAGVKVNNNPVKYASAHDLRRSFGTRWAQLVMPQVLMELMRHTDIKTTMRFYVSRNAQTTAEAVWNAAGMAGKVTQGQRGDFVGDTREKIA